LGDETRLYALSDRIWSMPCTLPAHE
jgi:hypothetical protein